MASFYEVFLAIIVTAILSSFFLERSHRTIFAMVIVSLILVAIDAGYFISWMAMLPCFFMIAFVAVIMSHPQMKPGASEFPEE